MRYRYVPPAFWQDSRVGSMSHAGRLLLLYLNNLVDADGRAELNVRFLRSNAFAYDERPPSIREVERLLDQLRACGLVEVYTHAGRSVVRVPYDVDAHPLSQYIRRYRGEKDRLPAPPHELDLFSNTSVRVGPSPDGGPRSGDG